ncbi:MAG: ATP-binding protein [Zetaproteobacteria bacterium CG12_big_fil_rev_8_21_14_0_65_55_1124]|nr:MAG: ATP-binding protein [Zetaproteobacteria bacterium CG1_02_55_237]PIS18558.1 MAG: ATP-binding protein [Zetaproteobacteria bacterium CG08_land_8_20_14_0_20_55_17]PIW42034.1 MAG: ATP-binding protein [Zetaproteobacteria bacterium CG12_big_fil_rev_8_21_14_0_65_55_1124]PIY53940.1 MAG: ATP-binding protein [Zetaproteobacteria bacterium CG_4_10_14_0_8_um_filter_55_43]PIZ39385.1 MAG: ATP-binding protein [Zetaproteobacteria bacterium CG_4_10_14_0_2_um_filter_55_20]PJB80741.1 MAG: ATP-binding prote
MVSLRQRLILSLAASLAFFFIVQTLMIGNEVEDLGERNLLSRLQHDQDQILAALEWTPPAAPELRQSLIPGIYERPFSGHYFQLDIGGESLRSRSLWDEQMPPQSESMMHDVPGPDGQRLLILQNAVQINGQTITIRTAENILPIEFSTGVFQRHLLLFAVAAVVALMVLQGWLIGYSLKPLRRVQRQINRLKNGDLGQIDAPAPDEIMPLVEEINHLMRLMQQRLQRSRHALGDLAHSLKTPLAVARQIVQRQPDSADNQQLGEQLERIVQRIERELVRARTAGRMPGGQWADPEQDIRDMSQMLAQVFPHIMFDLQIDANLKIPADREDMMEIFGNLLENACKWAHSEVRCSVRNEQRKTSICIEDDGPGIEAEEYEHLLFRGTRADESQPGHGLGLSIVSEMVAAYEGNIELSRSSDLYGLKVSILLS